ncbi:MAG: hypothetical protein D4R64_07570 [Porphyromonadaceae bacterium]|nr:MAG: hypothetical protein D4R64_07570 [Porphyromonadaceae bacterium]
MLKKIELQKKFKKMGYLYTQIGIKLSQSKSLINRKEDIMRKNIMSIILTGVFAWMAMGTQAQNFRIEIVKGQVVDLNQDHHWDFVTFGLTGPASFSVTYVEILNENGTSCGIVYNPMRISRDRISWFLINLEEFNTQRVFYLKVHVVKNNGSTSDSISLMTTPQNAGTSPIVPDETILIVKYP